MPSGDGGLGSSLVGEKIMVNSRQVQVAKLLGEGGFSYVYLVKELSDTASGQSLNNTVHGGEERSQRSGSATGATGGGGKGGSLGTGGGRRSIGNDQGPAAKREFVLKVTSILSRQQRDIAEKEAKLLSRLSHPSIIKMFDTCYRTVTNEKRGRGKSSDSDRKERPQHLILMEFCEGGEALDVCSNMVANGERFDLSTLIIAFGQICNAVSYLHAQRPPIVHRDLKPANFLIKNGAYKLCDFGSAVFGHVDLRTQKARAEAEEVIQKTTTQMFRSPEMVDLYMAKKLTQATDVWALGACLYSLAFLQNCFEEGSNLAILSRKFKIPEDNPYGDGLVELIDRMLTIDCKARADMTEVILCLSAVYSGRPLPPRKERSSKKKDKDKEKSKDKDDSDKGSDKGGSGHERDKKKKGTFRTDGQGMYEEDLALDPNALEKKEAKKLDPNSAAARRRAAAGDRDLNFESFHSKFEEPSKVDPSLAFSTADNAFASFDAKNENSGDSGGNKDVFNSFDESAQDLANDDALDDAFTKDQDWVEGKSGSDKEGKGGTFSDFASFSPEAGGDAQMTKGNASADGDDDDDDGDNDEQEDGEENGDNEGGRDKERTRPKQNRTRSKSKSGRSSRRSTDSKKTTDDEKGEEGGAPKQRSVRRTKSGSRHGPSRTKSPSSLQDAANAVSGSKDDGDDESAKRRRARRSSGGDGAPRTPSASRRTVLSRTNSGSERRSRHSGKDKDGQHSKEGQPKSSPRAPPVSAGEDK